LRDGVVRESVCSEHGLHHLLDGDTMLLRGCSAILELRGGVQFLTIAGSDLYANVSELC
jgi:hypothetical protein